jgi:hypothetical protein
MRNIDGLKPQKARLLSLVTYMAFGRAQHWHVTAQAQA